MQLDIFEHSRDVMLRNDVIDGLQHHDAAAARAAGDRLAREFPADPSLAALRTLQQGLESGDREPFTSHAALCRARQAVEALQPCAESVFGAQAARHWLAVLWERLAQRAGALPFRADSAEDHAAPLWLRAGNWGAAARAVDSIESWRRIPAPLAWMTEARLHLLGLQASWPCIAELGWLSARRLDAVMRRCEDPLLSSLLRRFDQRFDGDGNADDAAWFVAWVLVERPDLAAHLAVAGRSNQQPPERAFRTLVELLGLERQGRQRDIIERRRTLRELHPSLYGEYMKTR